MQNDDGRMPALMRWGVDPQQQQWAEVEHPHGRLGRVVEDLGAWVKVDWLDGGDTETFGQAGQRLLVGDVVALEGAALHLAPRRTLLQRAAAGDQAQTQWMAANVDTVIVVTGADGDLNLRRLERYAAFAAACGVKLEVVVTRVDLLTEEDALDAVASVERVLVGVPVHPVNALDALQVTAWAALLAPHHTYALVGSSGVGKSTLTNALVAEARQQTRSALPDGRGRHTTTARHLFMLRSGALLMDTPGMREMLPVGEASVADAAFPELEELAAGCRFSDCAHGGEPGCAVVAAAGTVDPARLLAWRKLRAELAWRNAAVDARAAGARKRAAKQLAREQNRLTRTRNGG